MEVSEESSINLSIVCVAPVRSFKKLLALTSNVAAAGMVQSAFVFGVLQHTCPDNCIRQSNRCVVPVLFSNCCEGGLFYRCCYVAVGALQGVAPGATTDGTAAPEPLFNCIT